MFRPEKGDKYYVQYWQASPIRKSSLTSLTRSKKGGEGDTCCVQVCCISFINACEIVRKRNKVLDTLHPCYTHILPITCFPCRTREDAHRRGEAAVAQHSARQRRIRGEMPRSLVRCVSPGSVGTRCATRLENCMHKYARM